MIRSLLHIVAIVSGMEHSGQSSSHYSDVAQASTKLATSYSEGKQ